MLQSYHFNGDLPTADVQKLRAKYAPTKFDFDDHVPTMSAHTIRAIGAVRTCLNFSEEAISTKKLNIAINAIQSKVIPPE